MGSQDVNFGVKGILLLVVAGAIYAVVSGLPGCSSSLENRVNSNRSTNNSLSNSPTKLMPYLSPTNSGSTVSKSNYSAIYNPPTIPVYNSK